MVNDWKSFRQIVNLSCALNLSSATIRETRVTYVRSLRQLVVTLSCNYGVIYVINVTILRRETHPPHSGCLDPSWC